MLDIRQSGASYTLRRPQRQQMWTINYFATKFAKGTKRYLCTFRFGGKTICKRPLGCRQGSDWQLIKWSAPRHKTRTHYYQHFQRKKLAHFWSSDAPLEWSDQTTFCSCLQEIFSWSQNFHNCDFWGDFFNPRKEQLLFVPTPDLIDSEAYKWTFCKW